MLYGVRSSKVTLKSPALQGSTRWNQASPGHLGRTCKGRHNPCFSESERHSGAWTPCTTHTKDRSMQTRCEECLSSEDIAIIGSQFVGGIRSRFSRTKSETTTVHRNHYQQCRFRVMAQLVSGKWGPSYPQPWRADPYLKNLSSGR